ncbi:MAG: DUF4178 domain-containing protein [Chitinophagaceae bacterium]
MSSTIIPQCPKCGRVLTFSHEQVNILQCACGAVINRKEGGTLIEKPFFVIQNKIELIQPGSFGKWKDRDFKVLGRFRGWFEESVFNYWTILFNDGELAYLGEGYGFYSILKRTTVHGPMASVNLDNLEIGTKKKLIKEIDFILEKKYKSYKWEIEGELYIPESDNIFRLFEFSSGNGQQIALFEFERNYVLAFEVFYASFESMQFTNLRHEANPGKSFTCINCKNQVHVKTYPYAQSCACNNCGMHYEMKGEGNFKGTGDRNSIDRFSEISLGSKGIVKGINYEVIGYALKEEKNQYASQWKEYTLYNPEEGFAFLSEFSGHWMYVREQGEAPVINKTATTISFRKESFQLYNRYSYLIVNAQGEFPYNLFNPEGTDVKEFISPPEVWIQETSKREGITWFLGQHIESSDLKDNFVFPVGLPPKSGVGAVEPKYYVNSTKLIAMAIIGVLFLIIVHAITSSTKQDRELLNGTYSFNDTTNTISFVTDKFILDKKSSNLQFNINAPVDNTWFELNASLVNATTGTEYGISKGVEYYYGYTDGENWSEGDRDATAYLGKIPAGTYFLQVTGQREQLYSNKLMGFHLQVKYDVNHDRNMWICILLLIIWPVIQYFRTNRIEKKRWYNSPFSPFTYAD